MNNFKAQLSKVPVKKKKSEWSVNDADTPLVRQRGNPMFDPKLTAQKNLADPRKEKEKVDNFHNLIAAISPKSMVVITKEDLRQENSRSRIPATFKKKQDRVKNSLRGKLIHKN